MSMTPYIEHTIPNPSYIEHTRPNPILTMNPNTTRTL